MSKVILAEKQSLPIQAIYYDGTNKENVMEFCGSDNAKIDQDENLIVKSLEVERVAKPTDFIVKGVDGEYYCSSAESFADNYWLDGFDFNHPDLEPREFMKQSNFVHTFRFSEDNFDDAVRFVENENIDGVRLYRESPYGPYKITRPSRESYTIKDGDIIVSDFKRVYPVDREIFLNSYSVFGQEVDPENELNDGCRIFLTKNLGDTDCRYGYMIEHVDHTFSGIHFQEKKLGDDEFYAGISDLSLIRILYDRVKSRSNIPTPGDVAILNASLAEIYKRSFNME